MTSKGAESGSSDQVEIDYSEITNSAPFMETLVNFLNETAIYMQEVKQKAGISPGCNSIIPMNEEEKQDNFSALLSILNATCQIELSNTESTYKTAQETVESKYQTPGPYPAAASARSMPKGRRMGTPRPGASPGRGRVQTPDQYFVPVAESSPVGGDFPEQQNYPCPTYTMLTSRSATLGDPSRGYPGGRSVPAGRSYGPSPFGGENNCEPDCNRHGGGRRRQ